MTILQGLQHKKLVAQSRKLLHEHQKNVNLLEELEKANPGITQVELAQTLGVAQQTLAHYEGGVSRIAVALLPRVARRLRDRDRSE